jgi:hypothetical protein
MLSSHLWRHEIGWASCPGEEALARARWGEGVGELGFGAGLLSGGGVRGEGGLGGEEVVEDGRDLTA